MKYFCLLFLLFTGCSVGYRKVNHSSDIVREDGRKLQVRGGSDTGLVMINADFRFARLSLPIELGTNTWEFLADDGGRVNDTALRERRFYRLDAPVLSIYQIGNGLGVKYPGLLSERKSIEFWVGGEMDFLKNGHRWVDFGLMYYHFGLVGVRIYGGLGSESVRTTTKAEGKSTLFWEDSAVGFGAGVEITIVPGEYFLNFLEFLWKKDQKHQRRLKYQRYGR